MSNGTVERPLADERPSSEVSIFVRHLPFAAVMLALIFRTAAVDPETLGHQYFFVAMVLGIVATAASLIVPWRRLPAWSAALVALADMAVVAFVEASGVQCSILLVLPVLWLASAYGTAGVVVSVIAGLGAVWLPEAIAWPEPPDITAERHTLVPMVLAATAIYVALAERRSAARRALLSRQSALVEEALDAANAHDVLLRGILNTIDVGVVALDADGRITHINRRAAGLLRDIYKVGDYAVRSSRALAADGVTPLGVDGSPTVRAARGETIDRELIYLVRGGTRMAMRVSAESLQDDGGARTGAVVVYQDVTAETEALAQREEFVSAVSHELRTPLTSILGYLELADDARDVPEEVRAHLRVVARNTERLLRLISDLLTAAQTRDGQIALFATPVDLREVISDAVLTHRPRAQDRGVQVVNRATRPCVVNGDRTRLGQVVDNIVSNAIKYSDEGSTVVLDLAVEGKTAHLSVRDQGIGIAQEEQQRVFSRFYRGRDVRSGPLPGTGLGLHITRQLVEAHGGEIGLVSAPGEGTTVDIYLPVEERR
ncbi:sensor histidine kinase [Georgenia alba]|uniref:histidine kinase n=1 Tax=Georgenia alba TaxID=2233858 RepID=A0ABW2QAH8_9MICO